VFLHTYSVHHDARNFTEPDLFLPERWINKCDGDGRLYMMHNTEAFLPFSYGPRNCIGKQLAMIEMRMITARLVQKFNFAPVLGTSQANKLARDWEDTLEDWFVFTKGSLYATVGLKQ
jgi:cytochrome P450